MGGLLIVASAGSTCRSVVAVDLAYVTPLGAGAESGLVLARVLAVIALFCMARLALTVLLAACARATRSRALAEAASWVGGVLGRRLVAAVIGAGLLPSLMKVPPGAPAAAPTGSTPPPTAVMRWLDTDGEGHGARRPLDPHLPAPVRELSSARPGDRRTGPPDEATGGTPGDQTTGGPGGRTWTVRRGEHLWSIAEEFLTESLGRRPTSAETAIYHRRLITANRHRLVDPEDPDLVFAGQTFVLPPP